jgi:hypothetical protein
MRLKIVKSIILNNPQYPTIYIHWPFVVSVSSSQPSNVRGLCEAVVEDANLEAMDNLLRRQNAKPKTSASRYVVHYQKEKG